MTGGVSAGVVRSGARVAMSRQGSSRKLLKLSRHKWQETESKLLDELDKVRKQLRITVHVLVAMLFVSVQVL